MAARASAYKPRPLSTEALATLKQAPVPVRPADRPYVLYWMLMYYARGMNFADIAHLRWVDIYDGRIHYTRRKTMRRGTGANFSVLITPEIADILANFPRGDNEYVLPILHHRRHATVQQRYNRVNKCRSTLSRVMSRLAKAHGIAMRVTSYVARHTFAAVVLRSGASKRELGDAFGHRDASTTEHYAEQLTGDELDHLQRLL